MADQPLESVYDKTVIHNRKGEVVGHAVLTLNDQAGMLTVDLWHIEPGWHAMHFHSVGDCSDPLDGFLRSGGHLALADHHKHGVASSGGFHAGDLANVYAHDITDSGKTHPQVRVTQILSWINSQRMPKSFALVIHAGPDDYISSPAGNAGPRIACGVLKFS